MLSEKYPESKDIATNFGKPEFTNEDGSVIGIEFTYGDKRFSAEFKENKKTQEFELQDVLNEVTNKKSDLEEKQGEAEQQKGDSDKLEENTKSDKSSYVTEDVLDKKLAELGNTISANFKSELSSVLSGSTSKNEKSEDGVDANSSDKKEEEKSTSNDQEVSNKDDKNAKSLVTSKVVAGSVISSDVLSILGYKN